MRLRRPLPAVQGDTLHIVGVGENRIGKVQTFTRLNGRHGAFLSGSNIRVETSADHPDERPALLRDPDDFVTHLNRHSPYVDGPLLARCFAVL